MSFFQTVHARLIDEGRKNNGKHGQYVLLVEHNTVCQQWVTEPFIQLLLNQGGSCE